MDLMRINRTARSLLTLNRDREYAALKRMLALEPTDTLLDAGCGDGFWTARFARHCAHVTGVDPEKRSIQQARRLHHAPNTTYITGVGERLPFRDQTFDKVVSVSSLEHFADPLQGLREMARVLKPGGRLAISVDCMLPENSDACFRDWHKDRHFVTRYFSQDELAKMMETTGVRPGPEPTVHLFRSRLAARLRQTFIRNPQPWLPLFPAFYTAVRVADALLCETHGQIIVATGSR
jgi:SAM-dependent methyltransferase